MLAAPHSGLLACSHARLHGMRQRKHHDGNAYLLDALLDRLPQTKKPHRGKLSPKRSG
jgi:hypothetical protein